MLDDRQKKNIIKDMCKGLTVFFVFAIISILVSIIGFIAGASGEIFSLSILGILIASFPIFVIDHNYQQLRDNKYTINHYNITKKWHGRHRMKSGKMSDVDYFVRTEDGLEVKITKRLYYDIEEGSDMVILELQSGEKHIYSLQNWRLMLNND